MNEEFYFVYSVGFFIIVPYFRKNLRNTKIILFYYPWTSFGLIIMINEVPEEEFLLNDFRSVYHSIAIVFIVNQEKKRFYQENMYNRNREVIGKVLILDLNCLNFLVVYSIKYLYLGIVFICAKKVLTIFGKSNQLNKLVLKWFQYLF